MTTATDQMTAALAAAMDWLGQEGRYREIVGHVILYEMHGPKPASDEEVAALAAETRVRLVAVMEQLTTAEAMWRDMHGNGPNLRLLHYSISTTNRELARGWDDPWDEMAAWHTNLQYRAEDLYKALKALGSPPPFPEP